MKIKPAFVLWNYRNVKGWRYFRVLGQTGNKGLTLMFRHVNLTFGVKAPKP